MSQDTNVENLIINKLTRAQYESITTPDPTQLYFVTDEGVSISTLDDVSLNNIVNGQILKYNATTQKWENSAASGGGTWGNITGTLSDQTDLQNALNAKQNTISDLSTIRNGASAGATALQPNDNITELVNNAGYISTTINQNVSVAGNTKDVAKTNPETLYVPNGLIMGGTAAAAGLVTRGLCGVSTPSSTGACNKEHLYINFDNTTTFNTGRQLILQAGEVGTHYGNNLYQFAVPRGDIIKNYCDNHYITTDTAQSISGQKTFTSSIKSSVNNSLALTLSTGEAFGVTVTRTDTNNEIKFGIGNGGDNRGIWDVRNNKWAFNITDNGKAYALGNEIAIKSDLNSLSPLRYSRYSIAQVNSTNKFIKLASMTYTQAGNRDFSYLFWVEILEASTVKCYALVRLSARWSSTSYQGHKFEILEKYGDSAASLEALKNLTYAYSLNTTTHKITAEIWLEIKNAGWISYYLRPTECNEYGDYSNTPVTLSDNIWTYYNKSGDASSIASTAITSGLTQVKVTDATGIRNENNLSQVIKMWSGTKAQYDAIATKDNNTLYNITDDSNPTLSMLELLYPIGSIYIGTMSACPLQTLGVGTWQLVATDRVLQGAGTRGSVGDTLNERLPNITGTAQTAPGRSSFIADGVFQYFTTQNATNVYANGAAQTNTQYGISFDASRSSSTYQNNAPVQQDAYLVNIWERIS